MKYFEVIAIISLSALLMVGCAGYDYSKLRPSPGGYRYSERYIRNGVVDQVGLAAEWDRQVKEEVEIETGVNRLSERTLFTDMIHEMLNYDNLFEH